METQLTNAVSVEGNYNAVPLSFYYIWCISSYNA